MKKILSVILLLPSFVKLTACNTSNKKIEHDNVDIVEPVIDGNKVYNSAIIEEEYLRDCEGKFWLDKISDNRLKCKIMVYGMNPVIVVPDIYKMYRVYFALEFSNYTGQGRFEEVKKIIDLSNSEEIVNEVFYEESGYFNYVVFDGISNLWEVINVMSLEKINKLLGIENLISLTIWCYYLT